MKKHNRLYLAGLVVVLIGEAVSTGLLPISRGALFRLFGSHYGNIWIILSLYGFNYFAIDLFQSFKTFMVIKVSLWYRTLRTQSVKDNLFEKLDLSTIELPTNCPQRIQDDIKASYFNRITVWSEYFVSGLILVQLLLLNLDVPLLILGSIIYSVISVCIAIKFNPKLTEAEQIVQQEEANYRTDLTKSLLSIGHIYIANQANIKAARIRLGYMLFTRLQLGIVAVLPYIILAPKLLAGKIDLGLLIQHQATFGLIVVNASILIQLYLILVQGKVSEDRVKEIEK